MRIFALSFFLCLAPGLNSAVMAQEQGFTLDLNAAAQTPEGACRLTYVVTNPTEIDLSRAAYEVAVFDTEGVVQRLLALDFGALAPGKTKILQFDLPQIGCDAISRIVVNDVASCEVAQTGAQSPACMAGITAVSRTAIQFGL